MTNVPDCPAMVVASDADWRARYAWYVRETTGCTEDEALRIAAQTERPEHVLVRGLVR